MFTGYLIIYLNAKTIKKVYPSMYEARFSWSYTMFKKMVRLKLKDKILELGIREKDQVKQISDLVKQKANNEKTPYIIYATTVGILLAPIWYTFIEKIFDLYKDDIISLVMVFVGASISVIVLSLPFTQLREIRDNMLTKHNELNRLSEIIDDIQLQW